MKVAKRRSDWITDLHQYSLLMWSAKMDDHHRQKHLMLAPEQLASYSQQIIEFNRKCNKSMFQKVPVVCSEQTHWKARKMIPLLVYLNMQSSRRPETDKAVTYMMEHDEEF